MAKEREIFMTQKQYHYTSRLGAFVLACAVLTLSVIALLAQAPTPQVKITGVPPAKDGNPRDMYRISGEVTGVQQPKDYAVVIYAFAGGQWWVQPYDYQPKTAINNGKFQTVTHGGSAYAALLVMASFDPDKTMQSLPEVGGDIVAIHSVDGK
jgi:hypothetical protein